MGLRRATFAAASGERNAVTVTLDGTAVRIADAGAPLTVGPGCVADGASARCELVTDHYTVLRLALGDGDDSATVGAIKVRAEIDGGDGNDTLTATSVAGFVGGTGDDVIHGGERGDSIDPGPGADTVMAGGGGDFLYADTDLPPVADRYDGGEGEDQISYLNRRTGVRVDLVAGVGGEPDEDDALTGLEDVTGSVASDVLAGDDGPNRFFTRASQGDRFLGRGGDDRIEGSSHGDRIDGGPGDDHIRTEGGADRVDGGPGRDEVLVRFTRESGHVAVACDGDDTVEIADPRPASLGPRCTRLVVDDVAVRLHRRSLTARWMRQGHPAPCRLQVTFTRAGHVRARTEVGRLGRAHARNIRAPAGRVTVAPATANCGSDFGSPERFTFTFG